MRGVCVRREVDTIDVVIYTIFIELIFNKIHGYIPNTILSLRCQKGTKLNFLKQIV